MHQSTDLGFVGKPGGGLHNFDETLCTVSLHEMSRRKMHLPPSLPLSTLARRDD